jgi:HSP20 family protein
MAENKVVRNASEQIANREPATGMFGARSLFGPMAPFGDLFGMNPFALMREFTKEMDRAFSTPLSAGVTSQAWAPVLDVKEANGNLVVTAELPGIKPGDIKVEVAGQTLTIQGERKEEKKEEKEGMYRSERSYGRFYRSIPLPDRAKTDQIKAEMTNGVLELSVPLAEAKRNSRQIPVTAKDGPNVHEKQTAAA